MIHRYIVLTGKRMIDVFACSERQAYNEAKIRLGNRIMILKIFKVIK